MIESNNVLEDDLNHRRLRKGGIKDETLAADLAIDFAKSLGTRFSFPEPERTWWFRAASGKPVTRESASLAGDMTRFAFPVFFRTVIREIISAGYATASERSRSRRERPLDGTTRREEKGPKKPVQNKISAETEARKSADTHRQNTSTYDIGGCSATG